MRFGSPTARSNLSPLGTGFPRPLRSAFRFSQPPDGLLLRLPCGLVSYHWHSWGSPFRVFPSKAAPCSRRAWFPPQWDVFVSICISRYGNKWSVRFHWPEDKIRLTMSGISRFGNLRNSIMSKVPHPKM